MVTGKTKFRDKIIFKDQTHENTETNVWRYRLDDGITIKSVIHVFFTHSNHGAFD